ncbi:S53 family peptidase [Specibacter cremeus]|uniref:S53 family peptidase n=1 Tax=Specibacter cremeus TaxID=1629051 RepID=UPI000F7A98E4|nr:S53 family peptidase [Specibacter cremeus]
MESTPAQPDLPSVDLRPLPGSERPPAEGFNAAGAAPPPPGSAITATLVLRRKAEPDDGAFLVPLSTAELSAAYGADPADLALVVETMRSLGVDVVAEDAASRRVTVSGSARLLGHVFGTDLLEVETPGPGPNLRRRTGDLSVPAALDGVVTAVLGLDNRPQARVKFRVAPAAAGATSYTPLQLGDAYQFPAGADGTGTSIAIIELGGGFAQSELDTYFGGLGVTRAPITAVGVDGATNVPGQDPQGADGEVLLDIEVAGALAPGANIVVYFAPNTDAGFLNAVSQAAHASPTPAAMSISWGQSEDSWTDQARTAMDQAFADAALLGVSVTAAAGDDGSADRVPGNQPHADFPASSPHVLGCGGTRLEASGAKVVSETVWNDGAGRGATGGGVSRHFALPSWQQASNVPLLNGKPGRGVPDVAAVADPQTGYQVLVDGQRMVIGGTSAVAPLWAALLSRIAGANGKPLGLVAARLYSPAVASGTPQGFRDITVGNNGAYAAGAGWDACTGLGVPIGTALATLLGAVPAPTPTPPPPPKRKHKKH